MKVLLLLLAALLFSAPVLRAQTEHLVFPNVADPASGSPNNLHFVALNSAVTPKNKLFLFLPGTGGVPANYRLIVRHAANLGFHAVGLTYPNAVAINSLCGTVADTTCHSRARLEVFDGIDRHPGVAVDSLNCIQRRTLKLLQYLNATFPAENWGQFYAGNTILWNRIVVSGHSQGAGHAGIIAKLKKVDRVVMFAGTDWVAPLNRTADWITWPSQTPPANYYGFIHEDDEMVNYTLAQITWNRYGMTTWGRPVLVDATPPPYQQSHELFTRLTPANDPTKFHGAVVADAYTPLVGTVPAYQDAWTYLLSYTPAVLATTPPPAAADWRVYPNPFRDGLCLPAAAPGHTYQLRDLHGRVVQRGALTAEIRPAAALASGLYVLGIYGPEQTLVRTFKVVKE